MSNRYCVRIYETAQQDGTIRAGTVVEPIESFTSIYADSVDGAELLLQNEVESGRLLRGRVYQICPSLSVPELIRSVAALSDGSFERVFLDPAAGLYSNKRRVRLPDTSRFHAEPSRPLSQVLGY